MKRIERADSTIASALPALRSRLTFARRYIATSIVEYFGPPPSTRITAKLVKQKIKIKACGNWKTLFPSIMKLIKKVFRLTYIGMRTGKR